MNKEQQELLNDTYENYRDAFIEGHIHEELDKCLSQEEFIEEIKTDDEFSEKWGLKIEERELNDDELNIANLFKQTSTKLITITYNDTKLESYE
jgi:hypothetical protein